MVGRCSVISFSAGLVFYNSKKELERCLPTIPKHWKIIAVDGPYEGFDNSPQSTDGSRELIQSYPNAVIIDAPHLPKHKKRDVYLRNCDTDFLVIIDSDEWITGDIPKFEKACKDRATDDYHCYQIPVMVERFPFFWRNRPRVFYKPYEMEYVATHWTVKKVGDNREWFHTGTPHLIPIKGISLRHDHSLRNPDTEKKWMRYKQETIKQENRHNMYNLKNEDTEQRRILIEELGKTPEQADRILEKRHDAERKRFYDCFLADDIVYPLNQKLTEVILSHTPTSVFEFGCGQGKNLKPLKQRGVNVFGIDSNPQAIALTQQVVGEEYAIVGNEDVLPNCVGKADVAFTCSVLDHIPKVDGIINELKRIARKAVIIAETKDQVRQFYFPHDYESYGFKRLDYEWVSPVTGARYHIYISDSSLVS